MALTAEDIVNKRFQSTKFREGYDQDEVDDFLDEVVVEMRRVLAENEDLTQKLAASEARIAELQRRASGHQLQGCFPQMVLKGHPKHGLGSVNGRRCRHGPVRQGPGVRSLASGQQTGRGECRRKGTQHDRA